MSPDRERIVIDEIRQLYDFNRWANERMLAAASALTQDQFTRDLGSSFPSVCSTLVHIVGADWIWLERWQGRSPTAAPTWNLNTVDQIRSQWASLERDRIVFLETLTDTDLHRAVSYRTLGGEPHTNQLWQLLRHVVNHATYHRGQVTTLLRQLGMPAPATDLITFYRQAPAPEPRPA